MDRIVEDQKLARLDRLFQETQTKLSQKEEESDIKDKEIHSLKSDYSRLQKDMQNRESVVVELRNQLDNLSRKTAESEDEDRSVREEEMKILKSANNDLEEELFNKDKLNSELQDQLDNLSRKLTDSEKGIIHDQEKSEEINKLQSENTNLEKELLNKDKMLVELREQLDILSREIAESEDEKNLEDKKTIVKLNSDIQVLMNRIQFQVSEIFRLQNLVEEKHSILTHILQFRDRDYELLDEFEKNRVDKEKLETWHSEQSNVQKEKEQLRTVNRTMADKIGNLEKEYEQKITLLKDAESQISKLEESLQIEKDNCKAYEDDALDLQNEKNDLEKTVGSLDARIRTFKTKMEIVEKGKHILRNKVADDLVEKEVQIMKLLADIESYQVIFESYYKAKEDLKKHAILDGDWPDLK